jgi:hypothetical protein
MNPVRTLGSFLFILITKLSQYFKLTLVFVVSSSCFSFFVLLALDRSMLLASGFVECFALSLKPFRLKKKYLVCAKRSSWNLLKAMWSGMFGLGELMVPDKAKELV